MAEEHATVLVVDDNPDTVELLRKVLTVQGYRVLTAADGEAGLARVEESSPDLVILDVMMPKLDGYEVCRRLKADPRTRTIPVLMLTAKSDVADKVRGLDIGADEYVTKPFDYKEVVARVRSLLGRSREAGRMAEREKRFALDSLVDEVSHEVRNPLVAIGGFARRLQKNLADDDPNQRYLEVILDNVQALERMVGRLVSLKSAALAYTETTDINRVVRRVLERYRERMDQLGVTVDLHLAEQPPPVRLDRETFTAALGEIVDNALEAMAESATRRLTVITRPRDGFLDIVVADTGRGIAREDLKRIYDPFFTSKTYGPGLGLTYALKAVQSHKGTIAVDSEVGRGCRVRISLPVAPTPAAREG